jgi:hypothetical protein
LLILLVAGSRPESLLPQPSALPAARKSAPVVFMASFFLKERVLNRVTTSFSLARETKETKHR